MYSKADHALDSELLQQHGFRGRHGRTIGRLIAKVSRSLSIVFGRYMIRLSDESSRMAKRKRKLQSSRRRLLEDHVVDYLARKHDSSPEQARELMHSSTRLLQGFFAGSIRAGMSFSVKG
jgi:hypothetical protein